MQHLETEQFTLQSVSCGLVAAARISTSLPTYSGNSISSTLWACMDPCNFLRCLLVGLFTKSPVLDPATRAFEIF